MTSKLMEEQGADLAINQATSILRQTHTRPVGAGGKWDASQIYQALVGSMGMSPDQARAMIAAHSADYDPETKGARQKAASGFARDQNLNYLEQYGLLNGPIAGVLNAISRAGRKATAEISTPARNAGAAIQGLKESVHAGATELWYGDSVKRLDTQAMSSSELVESGLYRNNSEEAPRDFTKLEYIPGKGLGIGTNPNRDNLKATFTGYDTSIAGDLDIALSFRGDKELSGLRGYSRDVKSTLSSITSILKDPNHPAFKEALAFRQATDRDSKVKAFRSLTKSAPDIFQNQEFKDRVLGS
jgi:hypothetical protein